MNYVESFNLLGVEAKEIPCIKGEGAPTSATEGAVGCLYMDTLTGNTYKCVGGELGSLVWVETLKGAVTPDTLGEVIETGRNIIPIQWESGGISSNGILTNETTSIRSDFIEVISGAKLCFSWTEIGTFPTLYIAEYDKDKKFIVRKNDFFPNVMSPTSEKCAFVKLVSYHNSATDEEKQNGCFAYYEFGSVKKKERYNFDHINMKSINHRGFNSIAPENTLPAYRLSKQKGFDFVECDVVFTSDNIPVILHDTSINRTARNADGSSISETVDIASITYEQALTYDFGIWKGASYAGTKIPTFEEFIVLCKKLGLYAYIELKSSNTYTDENLSSLVAITEKYSMKRSVSYISFDADLLKRVAKVDEGARLGLCTADLVDYGAQRFLFKCKTATNTLFVDFGTSAINTERCDICEKYGLQIEVYSPNTEAEILALDDRVSGVTSDSLVAKEVIKNANIGATDAMSFPYAEYGMPIVYFEGDTTGMSKDNKVTLNYRYGERSGTCTLKWQGSSSLNYPKKNYTVNFDNAFEAKAGWGEQRKYCLKANYIDFSHARNICSARIWAGIVKNRPNGYYGYTTGDIQAFPNYGAIDGFPCMVVINGEYQGLYTFNIPKDGWMMNMGSGNREAILCCKGNYKSPSATYFNATAASVDECFDLEYVSDENDAEWVLESLNNMITAVMNYDGSNYEALYPYLDISSVIDYMNYIIALKAHDCVAKNYILATYDGVKWFVSAYDLDSTFGLHWDGTKFHESYQTEGVSGDTFAGLANKNKLFNIIWNTPALKNELTTRWKRYVYNKNGNEVGLWGVSNRFLAPSKVEEIFYNFAKDIPKAVLDEEVKLWKGIPSTSVNNVHQIMDWYRNRIERVNVELGI